MKKIILSLTVLMSMVGTTSGFASSKRIVKEQPTKEWRMDDDKTECKCEKKDKKCECKDECKCDKKGMHKGGPRGEHRGPRPQMIKATDGCNCPTCDSLRVMEQRMKEHMPH